MNYGSDDDKPYKRSNVISLEYYISSLLEVLRYARIWPAESFTLCKTLLSTTGTIVFAMGNFLVLLSEIAAFTTNIDLKLFANIIGVICMHAVGLIKWCYCIRRNGEMIDIVMKLEKCHELCQRIDNCEEGYRIYKEEMKHAHRDSKLFVYWWLCACIYGAFHWCMNPLLLGFFVPDQTDSVNRTFAKRNLPFVAWYPINTDDTNTYISLYFMQTIGGIGSVFGIVCYDSFYITMLIIICAQFRYINATLAKMDFDNDQTVFTFERKLKNCVDSHTEIVKFLKLLQNFTGPAMFVQCIETLILICVVSFEAAAIKIAIDPESILKLWSLIEYITCASCQLFFFCFFATRLSYLSMQIAYSVYFCGWQEMMFTTEFKPNLLSVKRRNESNQSNVKDMVQMIMLRAQRPIILTGGPFYVLSLETFKLILSAAISNSIILRTMSEADN